MAAALAAVLAFHTTNVGIISAMISIHTRQSFAKVVRQGAWFWPTHVLMGLTGAFLGGAYPQLGGFGIVMFTVPVLILRFTLTIYARQAQRTIQTLESAKAEVEAAHEEKETMLRKLIETVALIIDARDNSVSGHSRRVAKYSVAIGRELGMSPEDLASVHTAGLFHDLGKVGIPELLLHKPARLTDEEYVVVKQHAEIGERILSEVPQLVDISKMVGEHHERYDGGGYPKRLKADQISLGGRILMVADALETMLADRPYKRARPLEEALDELDRCAGTHFDPAIVGAVHRCVARHGGEFFTEAVDLPETRRPASQAAERILDQVFTDPAAPASPAAPAAPDARAA
jgi:putative nucleotidyltransferase with HDIG domain